MTAPSASAAPRLPLEAERTGAGFASWYELFPRSPDRRSGAARHLRRRDRAACRDIREMGFDVLYFPPIHPIGSDQPQGPQQHADARRRTISAAPTPSAVRRAGTTRSIPQLGTLDDFRRLVAAAREHGLEIALDFADPVLARTIRGCASIPTGSTGGRTARSDTPRTRRRSTRTSSTSTSTPRARCRRCGWRCATSCCSGSSRACASSASTIRTPSRCRSGNG